MAAQLEKSRRDQVEFTLLLRWATYLQRLLEPDLNVITCAAKAMVIPLGLVFIYQSLH